MWRILGIAIALQASVAAAQPSDGRKLDDTGKYAGNYLCVPLASGGVRWDQAAEEWRGTAFKVPSDGQFVFEIQVLDKNMEWESLGRSMVGRRYPGPSEVGTAYHANVRPLGGAVDECWGEGGFYRRAQWANVYYLIFMSPDGRFRCKTHEGLTQYDFNLTTLRYQSVYRAGFIDGEDTGGNTPALDVGKCTQMH